MADEHILAILEQGVAVWNPWKKDHGNERLDLTGVNLEKHNLRGIDFRHANLNGANLCGASLSHANLSFATATSAKLFNTNFPRAILQGCILDGARLKGANFEGANLQNASLQNVELVGANLSYANLRGADLRSADLRGAYLRKTDLTEATLDGANLKRAVLLRANCNQASFKGCQVYGISAWGLDLGMADQSELLITPSDEPAITLDNLELAQFVYLLLNSTKIRAVIDGITSKVVLILGRFTTDRRKVLEVIRRQLRSLGYVPIVCDFDKPATRDITETISTLAHMARFVLADITEAKSVPQELGRIVPNLPSVPVQPLILESEVEYGMFEHFKRFPWVLPIVKYQNSDDSVARLVVKLVASAEAKAGELRAPKL
jgi:uncharacterized protein YjbI with pentapeptide repeats